MPLIRDEGRALATIETIASIRAIEGADAIEAAQVRGWTVVAKKGEFAVGDLVVFFEIDTALPLDDERFAFLAPRSSKEIDGRPYHVLKTARLRGVYSQGLVLPVTDFGIHGAVGRFIGFDLTEDLNLYKWEPPLPIGGRGQTAGPFPEKYAQKTDSARAQNLTPLWPTLMNYAWEATEKVDGTSCTILRDETGQLRVCGRNWEISDDDNLYWNAVRRSGIDLDALEPGDVVQAEIVGPGIQANRLGLSDVRLVVFTVARNKLPLPRTLWPARALELAAPIYDLTLPGTAEEAIDQVDGLKSLVAPGRLAEGVVWHTVDGTVVPELGRNTFKAISNKYLTKEK